MSNAILPDKPSELLRLAIHDAKQCEADPRYMLHMDRWHAPTTLIPIGAVCLVCIAGSVMAQTLDCPPATHSRPDHYDEITKNKLQLIDRLRSCVLPPETSPELREKWRRHWFRRAPTPEGGDERLSWDQYLEMADDLEKEGL